MVRTLFFTFFKDSTIVISFFERALSSLRANATFGVQFNILAWRFFCIRDKREGQSTDSRFCGTAARKKSKITNTTREAENRSSLLIARLGFPGYDTVTATTTHTTLHVQGAISSPRRTERDSFSLARSLVSVVVVVFARFYALLSAFFCFLRPLSLVSNFRNRFESIVGNKNARYLISRLFFAKKER